MPCTECRFSSSSSSSSSSYYYYYYLVVGCWENKKDQHRTVEWTVNAEVDSPSSGGDDVK